MKKLIWNVFLTVAAAGVLSAAPVTFTGTSGNLSASATFENIGGNLVVTLTNTAHTTLIPAGVLTAVFFDINGVNPVLMPTSALLPAGSKTCLDTTCTAAGGLNVGGEWAYGTNPSGVSQEFGISSSGMGAFGASNFNGSNLEGPGAVDGMQYGIIAATYDPNGGLAGNTMISKAVVFTLSGLGANFDPSVSISNLRFQYGTALNEPHFPGTPTDPPPPSPEVPEPATMGAMGLGLAGLALLRRRMK